jgi:hypothetical protein
MPHPHGLHIQQHYILLLNYLLVMYLLLWVRDPNLLLCGSLFDSLSHVIVQFEMIINQAFRKKSSSMKKWQASHFTLNWSRVRS